MKILIDNGHGIQTKGKRSPGSKLLEYAYTRDLARHIVKILNPRGYDSKLLVPEDDDIPLSGSKQSSLEDAKNFAQTKNAKAEK